MRNNLISVSSSIQKIQDTKSLKQNRTVSLIVGWELSIPKLFFSIGEFAPSKGANKGTVQYFSEVTLMVNNIPITMPLSYLRSSTVFQWEEKDEPKEYTKWREYTPFGDDLELLLAMEYWQEKTYKLKVSSKDTMLKFNYQTSDYTSKATKYSFIILNNNDAKLEPSDILEDTFQYIAEHLNPVEEPEIIDESETIEESENKNEVK